MKDWQTNLISSGEILGNVKIRRGIFQGDSLSLLLFVICMIPLTLVLRELNKGYTIGNTTINHLFFMDDLKLFGKSEKQVVSLVNTVHTMSKDIGMEFGLQKCGVLVLKRGKVVRCGLELSSGKIINVERGGYRYLGILELDKVKEEEMKQQLKKEYKRRLRLILSSKLHGRNKFMVVNTWAVAVMWYGTEVLKCTTEELTELDRKTRKVMTMIVFFFVIIIFIMTMHGALHPKSVINRLYMPREKGGRGLISCERCIRSEENSVGWYVRNSNGGQLLETVKASGVVDLEAAVKPEQFKKEAVEEEMKTWREKKMHGKFLRQLDEVGVDIKGSWNWLKKADLKSSTEALICAAQEQALRTNCVKFHVDKSVESPLCRMCHEKGESVTHVIS